MSSDRKAYSAPKLTEFGRIEELTGDENLGDPKTIGWHDGWFLLGEGAPICQPDVNCHTPFSG